MHLNTFKGTNQIPLTGEIINKILMYIQNTHKKRKQQQQQQQQQGKEKRQNKILHKLIRMRKG